MRSWIDAPMSTADFKSKLERRVLILREELDKAREDWLREHPEDADDDERARYGL